jgi:sirohydrochlorin ferrochelatase
MSKNGIVIVDHGSRREESNQLLEQIATLFAKRFAEKYDIVEPAHMEIAEPSIAAAYDRCVKRGATRVIVCPFFLGPGKHWTSDIPRLAAEAAQQHAHTTYHVTHPLGIDDLILDLLEKRVRFCVEHEYVCDSCRETIRCGGVEAG